MKVTFEDDERKVIWDIPDISIRSKYKALHGDIACVPLECELELIKQETDKLRAKLLEPIYDGEGELFAPDPIRMALVLLMQYIDKERPADLITYINEVIEDQD